MWRPSRLSTVKCSLAVAMFLGKHAADAGHLFQPLLHLPASSSPSRGITSTDDGFGAAQPAGEILHRIRGHQLALGDDDDALAGLLDFGQNVRRKNNGVLAARGQPLIRSRVSMI